MGPGVEVLAASADGFARTLIIDSVMVVEERQFDVVVAVPSASVAALAPFLAGPYRLRLLPYFPRREFGADGPRPPQLVRQQ